MTWTSVEWEQRAYQKGLDASGPNRLQPMYSSILFYSVKHLATQRVLLLAQFRYIPNGLCLNTLSH